MADKQYQARLFQQARVHTETFDITAKDEKAAKAEADKIIKTKDLADVDYDVEIVEAAATEAPEASATTVPPEPIER